MQAGGDLHRRRWIAITATPPLLGVSSVIPSTLDSYIVGNSSSKNLPRSMAIAYKDISLNGVSVHLTEITGPGQVINNGWSADVDIFIYIFCKVDPLGHPYDPHIVPLPTINSSDESPDEEGGYCDCSPFLPINVGCNDKKFIAISFKAHHQNLALNITARTISVTLHGEQTDPLQMSI